MAPSPVSQAAWRACIDNIQACKAQSVPWGAQLQVDEESLDGLFSLPQLDTARRDVNTLEGRYMHAESHKQAHCPGAFPTPHLFSFRVFPLTRAAERGPESNDHTGGEEMYEGGE